MRMGELSRFGKSNERPALQAFIAGAQ